MELKLKDQHGQTLDDIEAAFSALNGQFLALVEARDPAALLTIVNQLMPQVGKLSASQDELKRQTSRAQELEKRFINAHHAAEQKPKTDDLLTQARALVRQLEQLSQEQQNAIHSAESAARQERQGSMLPHDIIEQIEAAYPYR